MAVDMELRRGVGAVLRRRWRPADTATSIPGWSRVAATAIVVRPPRERNGLAVPVGYLTGTGFGRLPGTWADTAG